MLLPLFCAAVLLAADIALRVLARRGKLKDVLPGGKIQLEALENRGMAGGALANHPRLTRFLPCAALLALLALCVGELLRGRGLCRWGAALLCAGGLGNGAERLCRGGAALPGLCHGLYPLSAPAGQTDAASCVESG